MQKDAGVAVLIAYKSDFSMWSTIRVRECYYIMKKVSIYQEDINNPECVFI